VTAGGPGVVPCNPIMCRFGFVYVPAFRWPKILWYSITFHAISRFVTHSHTVPLQPIDHQSLHIGVSHTETHRNRKHPAGVRFHIETCQSTRRSPSLIQFPYLQINNKGTFSFQNSKRRKRLGCFRTQFSRRAPLYFCPLSARDTACLTRSLFGGELPKQSSLTFSLYTTARPH